MYGLLYLIWSFSFVDFKFWSRTTKAAEAVNETDFPFVKFERNGKYKNNYAVHKFIVLFWLIELIVFSPFSSLSLSQFYSFQWKMTETLIRLPFTILKSCSAFIAISLLFFFVFLPIAFSCIPIRTQKYVWVFLALALPLVLFLFWFSILARSYLKMNHIRMILNMRSCCLSLAHSHKVFFYSLLFVRNFSIEFNWPVDVIFCWIRIYVLDWNSIDCMTDCMTNRPSGQPCSVHCVYFVGIFLLLERFFAYDTDAYDFFFFFLKKTWT